MRNILEGARIIDTFRFKGTQNGKRSESTAVLVTVGEETLPQRVNLGLLNFTDYSHVWPPLRYYKCQRHGHVAAVCWQTRRSGECGSDHEYSESAGRETVYCNCGETTWQHFRGCEHHVRAEQVLKI